MRLNPTRDGDIAINKLDQVIETDFFPVAFPSFQQVWHNTLPLKKMMSMNWKHQTGLDSNMKDPDFHHPSVMFMISFCKLDCRRIYPLKFIHKITICC